MKKYALFVYECRVPAVDRHCRKWRQIKKSGDRFSQMANLRKSTFFLRNISLNDIKRSVYQPVFGSLDSIDFHDVSDNAVINGACRLLQSSMLP